MHRKSFIRMLFAFVASAAMLEAAAAVFCPHAATLDVWVRRDETSSRYSYRAGQITLPHPGSLPVKILVNDLRTAQVKDVRQAYTSAAAVTPVGSSHGGIYPSTVVPTIALIP